MDKTQYITAIESHLVQASKLLGELADMIQPKPEWNDDEYDRKDKLRKPYEKVQVYVDLGLQNFANIDKPESRCHTCNQILPERMR